MAINTIDYDNKVALNENPSVADINKVKAEDMNEIKTVVNANANGVGDMSTLNTTATTVVGGINEINNSTIYSETENVVGTWINGKPIYRKCVAVNFGSSGTSTVTAHNIANIDEVTSYELRWYDTTDKSWYKNFKDVGTSYYLYAGPVSKTNITVLQNNYNWQGRTQNRYYIIEYTKTTD